MKSNDEGSVGRGDVRFGFFPRPTGEARTVDHHSLLFIFSQEFTRVRFVKPKYSNQCNYQRSVGGQRSDLRSFGAYEKKSYLGKGSPVKAKPIFSENFDGKIRHLTDDKGCETRLTFAVVDMGIFPRRDICRERARICGLTPREVEVARELVSGKTNDEIAGVMGVSVHTVRTHVERILAKVRVKTRTGAVAVLASFTDGSKKDQ